MKLIKELLEAYNPTKIRQVDVLVLGEPSMSIGDLYDGDDDSINVRTKDHNPVFTKERAIEVMEYLKTKGTVSYAIWKPSDIMRGVHDPMAQFYVWTNERHGELSYDIRQLMEDKGVKVSAWIGDTDDGSGYTKHEGQELIESVEEVEYEFHLTPMAFEADHEVSIEDMFDGDEEAAKAIHGRMYKDGVHRQFYLDDDDMEIIEQIYKDYGIRTMLRFVKKDKMMSIEGMIYLPNTVNIPLSYWEGDDSLYGAERWMTDLIEPTIKERKGEGKFMVDIFPTGRKISK